MRRAVLDPGVLVSALITPGGAPAKLVAQAPGGGLELILSPLLLGELEEVLAREKFRRYVDLGSTRDYLAQLRREGTSAADPEGPPPLRSADPDDDYLIALAHDQSAIIVSGDRHLLDLADRAPILSPADLLATALA
ncbi:MAG: putative toxin-antitoxin system toxin component, PIN family [Solirubrobacterales bacterium]